MSGGFQGLDPATVKDMAAAVQRANLVAGEARDTLVMVKARGDAVPGERGERLRESLGPAVRQADRSVQVASALTPRLLGEIGAQVDASTGLTPAQVVRYARVGNPPRMSFDKPDPSAVRRKLKVAGLGDSFQAGEGVGEGAYDGIKKYYDAYDRRHRSPLAPVAQALERVRAANKDLEVELHFAASSGAVTRDVVVPQTEEAKRTGKTANWQVNPAQLFQIPRDADVVVAGFGGNDARFGPVVTAAHAGGFEKELAKAKELLSDRDKNGKEYTDEDYRRQAATSEVGLAPTVVARWLQIIDEIRNRAPNAAIVIPNYPQAVDPKVLDEASNLVSIDEANAIKQDLADGLNKALTKVVELAGPGVSLADVSDTFKGHEVYTQQPWLNGVDPVLGNTNRDFVYRGKAGNEEYESWQDKEPFHPNDVGYSAMAGPIASVISASRGLAPPPQVPAGTVTPAEHIKVIQGFSDFDGDGVADDKDDTPGVPTYKRLVNRPPAVPPMPQIRPSRP